MSTTYLIQQKNTTDVMYLSVESKNIEDLITVFNNVAINVYV